MDAMCPIIVIRRSGIIHLTLFRNNFQILTPQPWLLSRPVTGSAGSLLPKQATVVVKDYGSLLTIKPNTLPAGILLMAGPAGILCGYVKLICILLLRRNILFRGNDVQLLADSLLTCKQVFSSLFRREGGIRQLADDGVSNISEHIQLWFRRLLQFLFIKKMNGAINAVVTTSTMRIATAHAVDGFCQQRMMALNVFYRCLF